MTVEFNQLPELSDKKMDATNALLEPPLKHAKNDHLACENQALFVRKSVLSEPISTVPGREWSGKHPRTASSSQRAPTPMLAPGSSRVSRVPASPNNSLPPLHRDDAVCVRLGLFVVCPPVMRIFVLTLSYYEWLEMSR